MAIQTPTIDPTTRQYTDLDLSLQRHPVTGDIAIKTGDNAVIAAIRTIIMTNFYERWHPELACGVQGSLYELITPLTAQILKKKIETAITNFEKRVKLINVIVTAFPEKNYYQVSIGFYIQNNSNPTNINIFLERVR